jgi:predicted Zn-dependent protease
MTREARIKLVEEPVRVQINGFPAARARGQAGGRGTLAFLDLTWIVHGNRIFQIVGASSPADFPAFEGAFEATAMSFRRLGKDRHKVTESRLRLVNARSREKLPALVERSNGTWSPEESAVANAWEVDKPLSRGQLVKMPIAERFRPSQ